MAHKAEERVWTLQCKNVKCQKLFDYFGPLNPSTYSGISCTHCGKFSKYLIIDFTSQNEVPEISQPEEE